MRLTHQCQMTLKIAVRHKHLVFNEFEESKFGHILILPQVYTMMQGSFNPLGSEESFSEIRNQNYSLLHTTNKRILMEAPSISSLSLRKAWSTCSTEIITYSSHIADPFRAISEPLQCPVTAYTHTSLFPVLCNASGHCCRV